MAKLEAENERLRAERNAGGDVVRQKLHTPAFCPICEDAFHYGGDLYRHMKERHQS